jgi:hypothetical protein
MAEALAVPLAGTYPPGKPVGSLWLPPLFGGG